MRVELTAIQFNYEADLTKTGAFNLRRSETRTVRVPEWQPDVSDNFEASPAAYAICGLPEEMTIQASFKCQSGLNTPLMIKAIAEPSGHVLGDIEPQEIPNTATTGFVTFKLPHARVASVGVGIHDIAWHWQYSDHPDVWTDVETTFHRIYTVLALPSCPWEAEARAESNIHQPWTDVLDYACLWASGARDLDEAATLITKNFFKLGEHLLRYEGGEYYAFATFHCTEFLRLLKTGVGPHTVNCDDCATIVSTFANILGCQLSQSSLGLDFKTNPVVSIGSTCFCSKDFIHHSVAWKGKCTAEDEVFDGCLQIDEDVAPPLIPVQAVNLPFGTANMGYRFSLVHGAPDVGPIPDDRTYGRRRRKLGAGYLAQLPLIDNKLINTLKQKFDFELWPKPQEEEIRSFASQQMVAAVLKRQPFTPDWSCDFGQHFRDDERFLNVFQFLLNRTDESSNKSLAINFYECKNATEANENLIQLLSRFEELKLRFMTESELDDVVIADSLKTIMLLRRAQWLFVVRSASLLPFSVVEFVSVLANDFGRAL